VGENGENGYSEDTMLKELAAKEYEITALVLDEDESAQLEALMCASRPEAVRSLAEAVDRARNRVTDRPLQELLAG
jgi:hypothetical protein